MLQAALRLANEHGVVELSMRNLGQTLGVEAMSLYNHVAIKDDLLARHPWAIGLMESRRRPSTATPRRGARLSPPRGIFHGNGGARLPGAGLDLILDGLERLAASP